MTETLKGDPIWVADPEHLQRVASILAGYDKLAIDTESNGLFVYHEEVCLIQISIPETDFLIDSLAIDDLSCLGELFADPSIEKIFHAAEYDLIGFKRDYDFDFVNIFDTMLAGRILGKKKLGLASMLTEYFNIHPDKRYQRANWGLRPLPPAQLAYARLDSHFLLDLRNILQKELEAQNLQSLAQEDFHKMCHVRVTTPENCFSNFWRVAGKERLSSREYAVLHALCEYRDKKAKAANKPEFKILGNKTLVQLAQRAPKGRNEFSGILGLTPHLIRRHGDSILAAVRKGQKAEPMKKPSRKMPDYSYLNRLDELKDWRKNTARGKGVESDVVLPRDVMEEIARRNPADFAELQDSMQEIPWRYEHYGKQILRVLDHQE